METKAGFPIQVSPDGDTSGFAAEPPTPKEIKERGEGEDPRQHQRREYDDAPRHCVTSGSTRLGSTLALRAFS